MKVIWGKFGTGVDLILCVIINYYVVSRNSYGSA